MPLTKEEAEELRRLHHQAVLAAENVQMKFDDFKRTDEYMDAIHDSKASESAFDRRLAELTENPNGQG